MSIVKAESINLANSKLQIEPFGPQHNQPVYVKTRTTYSEEFFTDQD